MSSVEYNQYSQLRRFPYAITSLLVLTNDDIWKLLKYDTPDALSQSNLSQAEKGALIYSGQEDSSPFRVFMQAFTDDSVDEVQTHLNIYVGNVTPKNNILGTVDICFEILSHNKIIGLDDYENRNLVMLNELISTLNGQEIGGIGRLSFDGRTNFRNMAGFRYFNKWYQGYSIVMSILVS